MDAHKERYQKNLERLEEAFVNCGVACFTGTGSERARDEVTSEAYSYYRELGKVLGTDRLPVSEVFAVVPQTYVRVTKAVDEFGKSDAWMYFDQRPWLKLEKMIDKLMDSVIFEIFVGMELVVRDFRNFTEVAGEYAGTNIMKERKERKGFMAPNADARVFDMPLGMIIDLEYLEAEDIIFLTVADRGGNRFYYGIPAYRDFQPVEGVYMDLKYSAGFGDALMRGTGSKLLTGAKARRSLPHDGRIL